MLYNFSDSGTPQSSLTPDGAGNLYGTTYYGGPSGAGTVFELSPNGSGGWNEIVLYNFTGGLDGKYPGLSYVIFDKFGNLYSTASNGGAHGQGVVFELSPGGTSWAETVLYNFAGGTDGAIPANGLIVDPTGNFYGTTYYGGSGNGGTVFELSPSGGGWNEQVIYNNGAGSNSGGGLTMNASGDIFGVTPSAVFELSPNGSGGWNSTVVHTFAGAPKDGSNAYTAPALDKSGSLYGTTTTGGSKNLGTVYKLSPVLSGKNKGTYTQKILYSFQGGKDGTNPYAGIVFDASGNIYGTTYAGGKNGGWGSVYELVAPVGTSTAYKEKVLWSFNGTNGGKPYDSPILDGSRHLYGTTTVGGSGGRGVVFEVSGVFDGTATTLTSSPNPSTSGQAVTFTAVVASKVGPPPDGEKVTFKRGAAALGTGTLSSGSASFTTSALPVGTDAITAVYGGDSKFLTSTSKAVKQVVN